MNTPQDFRHGNSTRHARHRGRDLRPLSTADRLALADQRLVGLIEFLEVRGLRAEVLAAENIRALLAIAPMARRGLRAA